MDEIAKQPLWIAKRSRARLGYMLANADGQYAINTADHTFPLTEKFLVSTSGVVKCAALPKMEQINGSGDQPAVAKTFRPSAMHAFMRSHRYHSGGAQCCMDDLFAAVEADMELKDASILSIGSDNGGAYTLDSQFNIHMMGRLWRKSSKAMMIAGAYHAGGSKFNWEIEQQWVQPRRKLAGVELGKLSVVDPDNPLAGFDTAEEAFQHISDAGMREMHDLLVSCTVGGSPWSVSAPTNCTNVPDYADVLAYYAASPAASKQERFRTVREEAADIAAHVMKTPSLVQWRMCCSSNPCAKCIEVIAIRQQSQPSWNPRSVLHLLRWNNYWFPIAELRDGSCYPRSADEAASQSTSSGSGQGEDGLLSFDGISRPAADALRDRISSISKAMQEATDQEDFMRAHSLKVDKEKVLAELSGLLGQVEDAIAPTFIRLPTAKGDVWAKPGSHAYKTFDEHCQSIKPQTIVHIPVHAGGRRLEQVLPCGHKGCRYVAKTQVVVCV